MMYFDDKETIEELKSRLVKYIVTLDPYAKDLNELPNYDYPYLLNRYKRVFADRRYGRMFDDTIKDFIDSYHAANPDESLTDAEILYATDALNPNNFIGIIILRLDECRRRIADLKNESNQLTFSGEFAETDADVEAMRYDTSKSLSILANTVTRYDNMLKKIQEEFTPSKGR